ncbi:MAG: prenyltransferase/squalene oxidase repeat-containing protein [Bryobacteraceae bacterium]
MAEGDELQRQLLNAQNPDGGWGYGNGSSWTEPTAFALLALQAGRITAGHLTSTAAERGRAWLISTQRTDGGWPPKPSVPVSTWVTSLAALALSDTESASQQFSNAVHWLVNQSQPQLGVIERLAYRLRGMPVVIQPSGGSPWFPGTAAWIGPTAASVLALCEAARKNAARNNNGEGLKSRVREAREYILSRRCRDGGWNHGGSKYRSENAGSYPEMTGMALLALDRAPNWELNVSVKRAQALLRCPGSMEAQSWLQLGLINQGINFDPLNAASLLPCRTTRDLSLRLLALAGRTAGNKFLPLET